MRSELVRIPLPYEWGRVPIFGVGVLLAVWVVASLVTLVVLVRRQGWNSDTWSYVPLLLLLGAAIVGLPRLFPDGLPIRGYGLMVVIGTLAGVGLSVRRARQVGLEDELVLSLAFWMFICGILAARLFYVIEYWQEEFAGKDFGETLVGMLNFPSGGLVIYGALLGASVAFILFTRKHGLPLLATADLIAPSLVVGLAFGRIGCLLNGCCYGGPTDVPWAVTFPQFSSYVEETGDDSQKALYSPPYAEQAAHGQMHGFRWEWHDYGPVVARVDADSPAAVAGLHVGDVIEGINNYLVTSPRDAEKLVLRAFDELAPLRLTLGTGRITIINAAAHPERSLPVHPTQIYAAINAGLIAWLLWCYYPFRRRDGEVITLLLLIYPVTRFLLEIIRTDESAVFGTGLSISQNISVLAFVAALGMWWYLAKQPPRVHVWSPT